jgi:hypothetical protein
VAIPDTSPATGEEDGMGLLDKLLGRTKDVAGGAVEAAGDVAGKAVDAAGDVAGRAVDAAGDVAGSAADVAGDAIDRGSDLLDREAAAGGEHADGAERPAG